MKNTEVKMVPQKCSGCVFWKGEEILWGEKTYKFCNNKPSEIYELSGDTMPMYRDGQRALTTAADTTCRYGRAK